MLVVIADAIAVVPANDKPALVLKPKLDDSDAVAKSNFSALTLTVNVLDRIALTLLTSASQLKVNVDAGKSKASMT
jgi:hypothetical protein